MTKDPRYIETGKSNKAAKTSFLATGLAMI
jgi:hypothetical protein